jgi:FkbM family methyltransferase
MEYYKKEEEKFGPLSSRIYAFGSKHSLKDLYLFIARDIKKLSPKTILDIGAGPGDLSILLAKTIKNAKIYCVDPSPSMRRIAIKRIYKLGIKNVNYELGSSRHIPFEERFDVILTSISFHHWEEKRKSIEYLLKKLDKNGQLIIYEFCYDKLNNMQKTMMGKHSLSIKEAESYNFKGLKKNVNIHKNVIKVSFKIC